MRATFCACSTQSRHVQALSSESPRGPLEPTARRIVFDFGKRHSFQAGRCSAPAEKGCWGMSCAELQNRWAAVPQANHEAMHRHATAIGLYLQPFLN